MSDELSYHRSAFLAQASAVLAASLDYEMTLENVARLAVPAIADWCAVDLIGEGSGTDRLAIAHADPAKIDLVRRLHERYPPDPDATGGVPYVIRTGAPELLPELPDTLLVEVARDEEHLGLMRELASRSSMIAPLVARGRTLGAITLVYAESDRRYAPADLGLAEELARRAAVAIDSARLVRDLEEARDQLERQAVELEMQAEALDVQAAELTRSAELLRAVNEERSALLESAGDGIYGLDPEGRFTFLNRAGAEMLGYAPEDVLGRNAHALIHGRRSDGSSYPQEECPIFRAVHLGDGVRAYGELLWRKDGSAFMADCSAYPVREDGVVRGAVVTFKDATERRRAEEELRKAKELAESAGRAKSQFLATMSHELRTPLNAVIGYGDLIESEVAGPLGDKQREYLGRIRASARHLLHLIDQLLSLSRIEAGKEEVHLERTNIAALARDAAALVRPQAERKGLHLCVQTPEEPLMVETDQDKLRQILLNLLSNAIKFTEAGEVRLGVHREERGAVLFEIGDTGIGIASEDLERIFEPFTQVDQSNTRRQGGTGLGLPISRQLTRLLGGELWVNSMIGQGSTFTIRLPARSLVIA